VIIIVAIAAFVALNVFSSGFGSASLDSLQADLATIASSSQSYYHKPAMIGGGGRSFEGIDFAKFSFSRDINIDEGNPLRAENENGTFQISDISSEDFIVTGTLRGEEETTVSIRVCPDDFIRRSEY